MSRFAVMMTVLHEDFSLDSERNLLQKLKPEQDRQADSRDRTHYHAAFDCGKILQKQSSLRFYTQQQWKKM